MKKLSLMLLTLLLFSCLIISCGNGNSDTNDSTDSGLDSTTPVGAMVTFDSDGGTEIKSQYIQINTTAFEPSKPIRKNYVFLGWFLGDEEQSFDTPVTENITLIAKWEPVEGGEAGNRCPSYELEAFNTEGLTGEKLDPSKSGKLTIINFWGTWCGPCKSELPDFNTVAGEYKDDIVVYAIHTDDRFAAAPNYIKNNFDELNMVFLKDEAQEGTYAELYYERLGGEDMYPYTVIVGVDGIVLENHKGI